MVINFIKGIIVGLLASIPLGPVGVLCLQRTLNKGRESGFITGMGSALADTFFAAVALLSLAFVDLFLSKYHNETLIIGGIIVLLFGVSILFKNPIKQIRRPKTSKKGLVGDFFSANFIVITNPGALFILLGLFAFIGIDTTANETNMLLAITLLGVFIGASSWWFLLTAIVNHFRNKFRLRQLLYINQISGIIIIVLGMISTFEGLYQIIKLL
ncbi:MAG: LysE family transporter [Bacteroidales bacterium]